MAAPEGEWWDIGYRYRWDGMIITAQPSNAVTAGYTVTRTWTGDDAADIYADSLPSGDDFRIAYWTGAAWLELDRDLITFSAATITVSFKLQAGIPAEGTDDNYYPYYDNDSPGSPPVNLNNVYHFHDAFEAYDVGDLVGQGPWVQYPGQTSTHVEDADVHAGLRVSCCRDTHRGARASLSGLTDSFELICYWDLDEKGGAGTADAQLRVTDTGAGTIEIGFRKSVSAGNWMVNPGDGRVDSGDPFSTDVWYKLTIAKLEGGNITFSVDDSPIHVVAEAHGTPLNIDIFADEGCEMRIDDIYIRLLVASEPTVTAGSEQEAPPPAIGPYSFIM